jgi:hypothetical protein
MTKTSSESRPSTLDEALDYFCIDRSIKGAHVPDYIGFTNWMFEEEEKRQATLQLPLHALASSEPTRAALEFWRQFLATAASAGIEIDDNGHRIDPETFPGKQGGRSNHKSINRAKLMFQYIHEAPKRLQSFLVLLQKPAADHVTRSSPQGSATQLEHRSAFFAAVARGDAPTAFKMLGRLREEVHDKGELEFLEATAYFHSNNFEKAIQYAEKVPKDSIDWPRAILIILESFAMQGKMDRILRKLADTVDIRVPNFFFILYLPNGCKKQR